jgi:hypothetical protein
MRRREDLRRGDLRMREGALFATMFGLGAGAVLVGVTVSRLVVGQAPERAAVEPPVAAAEAPPPAIVEPPPPAVFSPAAEPSAVVPPVVEPPAPPAVQRQQRTVVRKHRRAPVQEETPVATATVPRGEAEAVAPPSVAVAPPSAEGGDAPIAIVRGGAARPNSGGRAPGPRIIQVDPHDERR